MTWWEQALAYAFLLVAGYLAGYYYGSIDGEIERAREWLAGYHVGTSAGPVLCPTCNQLTTPRAEGGE